MTWEAGSRAAKPGQSSRPTPHVLACLVHADTKSRLTEALGARAKLRLVSTFAEVRRVLASSAGEPPALLVVWVRDETGASAGTLIREVRVTSPGLPVVGYCDADDAIGPDVRAFGEAGAHAILLRNVNDRGIALRSTLDLAGRESAADAVRRQVFPSLPESLHTFLDCVLTHPAEATDVKRTAKLLGVTRKTLFNRCRAARFPPSWEVYSWCRLFPVAHILGTTPRTIASIASELNFASDTALRNSVRRRLDATATDVRDGGGVPFVVTRFVQRVSDWRAANPEPGVPESD